MRFPLTAFAALTLVLPSVLLADRGYVSYDISWGTSEQAYTYVFSGTVTCAGSPCAARVHVELEGAQDTLTEVGESDADGHYLIKITAPGMPQQAMSWRLVGKALSPDAGDPVEVEGRMILMQDTTVVVDRSLRIEGHGV